MAADSLKKLHTDLVDSRNGYREAVKDAEPPLKALFSEMLALKEKDHAELHGALGRLGEKPNEDGSFMSTLHKTVISVRAAVTGLGTNALSAFVSGEEQIVDAYDAALKDCASDQAIVATLAQQKATLLTKIAQMKRMES
jgi:uncharacterized protein (TIGR02284 family)